jgi:hypothetical protein
MVEWGVMGYCNCMSHLLCTVLVVYSTIHTYPMYVFCEYDESTTVNQL